MSDQVQVTAYSAINYRGCKAFKIEPGERAMIVLGGKNEQGKTSALNGLEYALLGADAAPADVVRHGADAAELYVELDGGRYKILRKKTAAGTDSLVVRGPDGGKLDKPQMVLNSIIGTKFLDPVAFSRMKPKEQREALLRAVNVPLDLAANKAERERVYAERTGVNQQAKYAEADLANTPEPGEPQLERHDPEVSVAELTAEYQRLAGEHGAQNDLRQSLRECVERGKGHKAAMEAEAETINMLHIRGDAADHNEQVENREADEGLARDIDELRRRHAQARQTRTERYSADREGTASMISASKERQGIAESAYKAESETYRALKAKVDALPTLPDLAAMSTQIATADETNRGIRAIKQRNADVIRRADDAKKLRVQATERAERFKAQSKKLTEQIDAIDQARADAIKSVKMPLDGLDFGDDGLVYHGVPFEQVSDGARIKVSVAIAMSLQPKLKDIIIRDGAYLDEGNMAALERQAGEAGYRLWVERVGTGDAGALVFVDGTVQP